MAKTKEKKPLVPEAPAVAQEPVNDEDAVAKGRFLRQQGIINPDILRTQAATIIGVGAVGRQLAVQLASFGVPNIHLLDHDTVEEHNITTQGYLQDDVGRSKVEACTQAILAVDKSVKIRAIATKYEPKLMQTDVIFCCVDSIEVRQQIWEAEKDRLAFWGDARMLGENIRVLAVGDAQGKEYYPKTFFTANQAERGACTQRGLIYTACVSASLLMQQYCKWLRKFPVNNDVIFNLLSMELYHFTEPDAA